MPELPLLFFPNPTTVEKQRLGGGGAAITKPSAAEQRSRLDARFREIAESFHGLQASVQGLEPEQVLVLETIGDTVVNLAKAAQQIPGMEWLAEMDLDDIEPQAGFRHAKDQEKGLTCRLYAVMTNQQAMTQLISLWDNWCSDPTKQAKRNFGPFKDLFINLRDLRKWDVQDRIHSTGLLEFLNERLSEGVEEIRFEVELWCRQSKESRAQAFRSLAALISAQGGECIAQSVIPEILYHGVLVKMPAASVRETVNGILQRRHGALIRCEDVMFFRPFSQADFETAVPEAIATSTGEFERSLPSGNPILAVLDGLPLEHHATLDGRIIVNDADGLSESYSPSEQQHGTSMGSLVIHGDLNRDNEDALQTPVYFRPILVPKKDYDNRVHEAIPDDQLFIDVIHRAVRELFEGESPAAPTVKIINLSVANSFQPFDREPSPLARLLDWLSWKYRILFLVSVGNHTDDVTLDITLTEWQELSEEDQCTATIRALHEAQVTRRPFSPAEAINPLTIGALHSDDSELPEHDRRIDLLCGRRLPSPIGTNSSGHRRSIKPEIYFPGGRQLFHRPVGASDSPASFSLAEGNNPPGQCVACPGRAPLELDRTIHTRGTSNATALASRLGGKIYERLRDLKSEPGGDRLGDAEIAVLVKCLLVHGAAWGEGVELIDSTFKDEIYAEFDSTRRWRELDRLYYRFLGYGEVSPDVAMFSTDERITVVGWANITADEGHLFQLPLPSSLSGSKVKRRLTGTLAWCSPINPKHRNYREAFLWFDFDEKSLGISGTNGIRQVDKPSARRGTVEHRVLEGERVVAFDENEELEIKVSCRSDAGKLTDPVPYAIAITLEVAEPFEVSIFEEVRERIRPRVEIRTEE
jgi:hypothetical protein